ncbi:Activating transcription factor 7-interacting protein 1 [Papilio machaon]|uniref:Activating transcription factor 7-interacting protein 1 n=1 Tax=Papilio machaon TaxID=76193 RepID=A0A0N0PD43_PAPMA|nr:Activating transcription factor 7-interacting protein 1 [Papilio machaon]
MALHDTTRFCVDYIRLFTPARAASLRFVFNKSNIRDVITKYHTMQLTVDTGAPIDIEFKMSSIKEVIISNGNETFSDDIKNSSDIVKDNTCDTAENNHKLQNLQCNDKIAHKDDTASSVESEEIVKSTSEETSIDDFESKSHSPKSSTNEESKPEDIVNNDNPISQDQESESQYELSNHNSDEEENVMETDVTEKIDNVESEQQSNVIVPKPGVINQINGGENINTQDHENTTNDSKIYNKITLKGNEIIEQNEGEQTNNDIKNMDSESSIPDSVIDQVPNKGDEKKEQSLEDVTESKSENTDSLISPKIDNDDCKVIESESATDSTLQKSPKPDNSTKESEITPESVASAETDTKSSKIEKEVEKINENKTHNGKDNNDEVEDKLIEEKKESSLISKLTNILDLLSDDEEERHGDTSTNETSKVDKQCISLVDDDDVMLIDEETSVKEDAKTTSIQTDEVIPETCDENAALSQVKKDEVIDEKQETGSEEVVYNLDNNKLDSQTNNVKEISSSKPLLSLNFLNSCKKTLSDMTREDLEDFCSMKILESVLDRSNLGDLKVQLKTMAATIEEFKKKTNLLSKQNRDLQVVLKSVQEEQKKSSGTAVTPLKITRSVGMQVLMTDKSNAKRKNLQMNNSSVLPTQPSHVDKTNRNSSIQKLHKTKNQPIPVPRLVPAANTNNKTSPAAISNIADPGKSPQVPPLVNGVRNSPPVLKPEKRSRVQSVTVDLTDDEPPLKLTAKISPAPGVRLVPAQNLLPPQRPQFTPAMTSPRKVYIPISGPQSQNVRPGQAVVLKTVPPSPGLRPRMPANNNVNKVQPNTIRMNRPVSAGRHPAPLPDVVKQYQPTSWKALPPAPDLKLSKVENGIVISWKIDGYQEDSYEEITSYQLFAYQETNCPPSTALWKKIGDVKALPLPMACTLTQFLAGFKYYFAVRAIDIKSRFGPFSLPASILLLNKM